VLVRLLYEYVSRSAFVVVVVVVVGGGGGGR
jgi:hypothetical protein